MRSIQQAFAKKRDVVVVDPLYAATFLGLPQSAMDGLLARTIRQGDPVLAAALDDLSRHPLHAAVILYLLVNALVGKPSIRTSDLLASPWLRGVAHLLPSNEATPQEMSSILNDSGIAERLEREGFEYFDEDGSYYTDNLEYLPAWLLARFLGLPSEMNASQGELSEQLPELLDRMEDEIIVDEDGADPMIAIKLDEHSALTCLAAEARVKHELEADDLIDYLVNLVLTTESEV